ncbi:MAG: hypothetical protein F4107_07120 [Gemmatimonadetes bacterium]|nr:hypothetical protein [Gemmatimonadota bacterium]MYI65691.1 hypothetical protein [Gemmatimonadota bacterium]
MEVDLRHCGPAANRSEVTAFNRLKAGLASLQTEGKWVLLTNLTLSVTNQRQSDEIDIVAIGPPGVRVIEVKHWTDRSRQLAERAADLLNMKARRVGSKLRRVLPEAPYVDGAVLITQPPSKARRLLGRGKIRGVPFFSLAKDWQEALGLERRESLTPEQIAAAAHRLQPKRLVGPDGSLREFSSYVNLELVTPPASTFHRVYRGVHSVRQDRLLLHLYDFSSGEGTNLETIARREFEALHRLQRYPWAPRIYDSFQDAPNYPAEMSFFSIVDREAPSIGQRREDESWGVLARVDFARAAVRALAELHGEGEGDQPMLHRNLSPETILVKHDNSPVLTGFEQARIPSDITLAIDGVEDGRWPDVVSPEIRIGGLGAASPQSDIYSLCSSLQVLFPDEGVDWQSKGASRALAEGLEVAPDERVQLAELDRELTELLGEQLPPSPAPPARYWAEGQVVPFRGRDYRIVTRLGSGGVGTAFKVVELDRDTQGEVGTFVGKIAHDAANGEWARRSYQLAREPVSKHLALASVFEVTTEWQENEFVALSTWIDGSALADFTGVIPLLAEQNREDPQELATRWLRTMCEALDTMHRNGLAHGDVSPRNMILSGEDLVLTDYDCVARIGDTKRSGGATLYASPVNATNVEVTPADDIYALAASFFHVLFDREPFARDGDRLQKDELNWEGADRDEYPELVEFFERAVHTDSAEPLLTAADALGTLTKDSTSEPELVVEESPGQGIDASQPEEARIRSPNEVPWLRQLLTSYPGSRWGNRETRGLDTHFATQTYVKTELEAVLFDDIMNRRARLVILCGNAGDGKTAMLQHLAESLGMGRHDSSQRIVDQVIDDGLRVRMNLDGSAAFRGRSADEVLDGFLEPFRRGPPSEDIVHLLAINDGRLLEWIGGPPHTPLKSNLQDLLEVSSRESGEDSLETESHIAFYHLNQRSHVGSVLTKEKRIATEFLERLLNGLYGGDRARDTWEPCLSCSAKESCGVFRATKMFGPDGLQGVESRQIRERARKRLFSALQAVHFRGETHITVRELRTALVYILFGTHYCSDHHDRTVSSGRAYWDRAFAPESPRRQGDVLRELVHLDPALEAHPKVDRQLLRDAPFQSEERPEEQLASARRRAYFEWSEQRIRRVAGEEDAERSLSLAQGRNLPHFGDICLMNEEARGELCAHLCRGIARLGDLPPLAVERPDIVPLRIVPRTPTETAFWTEKPIHRFTLVSESDTSVEDDSDSKAPAVDERLPRKAYLTYRYQDGRTESLRLSAGLFHRLLRLAEGFQLGDVSTDDTFANLSVFLRRLVQEDDRELMAWSPMRDEVIYQVSAKFADRPEGRHQVLVIRPSQWDGGS